jgi:hypothetical protein
MIIVLNHRDVGVGLTSQTGVIVITSTRQLPGMPV